MEPTTFSLVELKSGVSDDSFISSVKNLNELPLYIGKCQHWVHSPTLSKKALTGSGSTMKKWDYLLVIKSSGAMPQALASSIDNAWSVHHDRSATTNPTRRSKSSRAHAARSTNPRATQRLESIRPLRSRCLRPATRPRSITGAVRSPTRFEPRDSANALQKLHRNDRHDAHRSSANVQPALVHAWRRGAVHEVH